MMCYRDRTFCTFCKECRLGNNCMDALTPDVQKLADHWWGKGEGEAPICTFADKPDCFEDTNND